MALKIVWFLVLVGSVEHVCAITVCKNLWSYSWSFMSQECNDEPIYEKNISEIIRSWGYTAEEHYLTTDDGYKILVERAYGTITKETPIVMVHGMLMNSLAFVVQGEKSFAKLLGRLGYDVWLVNYRGTKYSRGHVNLSTEDKKYWAYTIDDLGIHDVRTALKYVNDITKKKSIYIGYSLGTTGFFVYSTTFPEEVPQLVKGMVAMAPVINWKDTKTLVRYITPIWSTVKSKIVYDIYNGEVHSGMRPVIEPLLKLTPGFYMAQSILGLFFGDGYEQMDPISMKTSVFIVDSTGAEVASHYIQTYESGIFRKYDYGKEKNLEIYSTEEPPAYNVTQISVPVAIFAGDEDVISTKTNCDQLHSELQPSVRCGYCRLESWGHTDFLMARDIVEKLYLDIIDKIEDIETGKCQS